jgi:CPA1 family monovalent cation:H+ antiporter
MTFSDHDALVLLGLLVAGVALLALAQPLRIPYPILLVLGGLAIGFVPGMPHLELPPEVVLVGILPPLLYSSAFYTSVVDLRRNAKPIGVLAVGLVLMTTVVVAAVAHRLVGLDWGPAFVLGAVVSPTDPIAATAIARRLGVPRNVITIIEGESLVNDGTALVAYRYAVVAVTTGAFSLLHAGASFVLSVAGGIAVGLAVGWVVRYFRARIDNPPVEITIAFVTGWLAFLPADILHVSGVIAVVTAGVYVGWYTPLLTTPEVRLSGQAFWAIFTFLVNALLFVLVGLQLPAIVDALNARSWGSLLGDAVLVSLAVIAARIVWVLAAPSVARLIGVPETHWGASALVAWTGMRGAVSLAAALAIPNVTDAGAAFPDRDLIIFLAFAVILATLVGQGLTLPFAIRLLGLEDDGLDDKEEAKARILAADAALARLDELEREGWVREDTAERTRGLYGFRKDRFRARFDDMDDGEIEDRSQSYQRLRRELLAAEREAVSGLRRAGRINDEVFRRVWYDLDLEDQRLDI